MDAHEFFSDVLKPKLVTALAANEKSETPETDLDTILSVLKGEMRSPNGIGNDLRALIIMALLNPFDEDLDARTLMKDAFEILHGNSDDVQLMRLDYRNKKDRVRIDYDGYDITE